ncbi:MAG: DUF2793 domain-containing protein [Sphingomonas sp.]|uniref:DUF2793 domain-containing protein n=1 Tax=Sphingomonas sp. TaxID=28214 RepID=UPI001208D3EA|nr:DUF2793 domain-containing protein [Sphingomonas sp.]THD38334.1 MAG: DUF2793 domain-containing protein [Sphingomonas sp.]
MTETTDRFALPLLQPGQAQKEMFHNDALAALDLLVQPTVETIGLETPPTAPESGQCWIVGDSPVGAWAGKAGQLAGWSAAGWRFAVPREGTAAWVIADALTARYRDGGWTLGEETAAHLAIGGDAVVGARQAAIAAPSGGATVDAESRTAIAAMLGALRAHGLIAS